MIRIQTKLRGNGIEEMKDRVGEAAKSAPQILGKYMVIELQGPGSDWPVRTGLSKASFGHRVAGERIIVTNSTPYAEHVEERTGAGYDTVERNVERITEQASIEIQEILDA